MPMYVSDMRNSLHSFHKLSRGTVSLAFAERVKAMRLSASTSPLVVSPITSHHASSFAFGNLLTNVNASKQSAQWNVSH